LAALAGADFGAGLASFLSAGAGLAFAAGFGAGLLAFAGLAGAGFFAEAGFEEPALAFGLAAGDFAEEAAFLVDMEKRDGGGIQAKFSHYSASGPGSVAGGNNRSSSRTVKD
jgi:hypothetical protein